MNHLTKFHDYFVSIVVSLCLTLILTSFFLSKVFNIPEQKDMCNIILAIGMGIFLIKYLHESSVKEYRFKEVFDKIEQLDFNATYGCNKKLSKLIKYSYLIFINTLLVPISVIVVSSSLLFNSNNVQIYNICTDEMMKMPINEKFPKEFKDQLFKIFDNTELEKQKDEILKLLHLSLSKPDERKELDQICSNVSEFYSNKDSIDKVEKITKRWKTTPMLIALLFLLMYSVFFLFSDIFHITSIDIFKESFPTCSKSNVSANIYTLQKTVKIWKVINIAVLSVGGFVLLCYFLIFLLEIFNLYTGNLKFNNLFIFEKYAIGIILALQSILDWILNRKFFFSPGKIEIC